MIFFIGCGGGGSLGVTLYASWRCIIYYNLIFFRSIGSFKIRGVANQMANLPQEVKSGKRKLITMSAGNYGKAFAYTLDKLNLSGLCLMPLTAPSSRVALIKV